MKIKHIQGLSTTKRIYNVSLIMQPVAVAARLTLRNSTMYSLNDVNLL